MISADASPCHYASLDAVNLYIFSAVLFFFRSRYLLAQLSRGVGGLLRHYFTGKAHLLNAFCYAFEFHRFFGRLRYLTMFYVYRRNSHRGLVYRVADTLHDECSIIYDAVAAVSLSMSI